MTGEEIDLLREGKVISVIKLVRERTGMNLRDAKDFVNRTRGSDLG